MQYNRTRNSDALIRRLPQHTSGNWKNIYLQETPKGLSLFTNRKFRKDETIFVASGPIVNTGTRFTVPIDFGLFINTIKYNNPARYICHSCNPNTGVHFRSVFVAMRDIDVDEEVLIDYAMVVPDYGNEITEEELICKCKSINCRGKLGSWNNLPEEIKLKYEGYISDYLL